MSAPRTKRQFAGASADPSQRQITSFFTSQRSSPDGGSITSAAQQQQPMQPALPSNVQSNLLSVGMRVRKSVPEGYKTGGTSAFKLWSDNTPATAAVVTPSPSITSSRSRTAARASNRELLPFCGINRVGGLDVQPGHQFDNVDDEDEDLPPLDSLPELTMSQESTDSVVEPSRKRFLDADEDAVGAVDTPQRWQDGSGPRSLMPMGYRNTRAMAAGTPRFGAVKSPSMDDQENMAIDEDFDEADFLVFSETARMDTV